MPSSPSATRSRRSPTATLPCLPALLVIAYPRSLRVGDVITFLVTAAVLLIYVHYHNVLVQEPWSTTSTPSVPLECKLFLPGFSCVPAIHSNDLNQNFCQIHNSRKFLGAGSLMCSPECQQVDWKDGEHQKSCNSIHSLRLSERQPLRNYEHAFLRAVLMHDYTAAKLEEVYPQQILLASEYTKPQSLVTLFDYRAAGGRVRIEVQPPETLGEGKHAAGWWNDVRRAARSGGRMHLHVVVLPGGGGAPEYLLVPLRTETSQAQDVVDGFARRLPSGAKIQVVRDLVKRGKSALDGPGKETY
ncbi:hypothetical protein C8R46DRAFT_1200967 [Mycena filopes]|nr:hypothetical protein C8R46DRAFT_1200967 [Mycena filopes]